MKDTIKQDVNFLEHPLWMQKSKKADGQVVKWTDSDGYVFEAYGGVPGKVDVLFLYYFLMEAQNHNWNQDITVTRYQVLNVCGMTIGKAQRDRLKQSLEIWKRVTVAFSGTFYGGGEYSYMEFGVIDEWKIREKDKKLEVRLNWSWLEKIRQSEFFKYISFSQIKALRSPLTLRLYEILVKSFYQRDSWEIGVIRLAEKIPMEKSEMYFSIITRKIVPAVRRISDKTELSISVEVVKQRRGQGKFIFKKAVRQKPKQKELFPEKQPEALPEIPKDILSMIPVSDRAGCMNLALKVFNRDGADSLRFYIAKTNARKKIDIGSYSGYLKTIVDLNLYDTVVGERQAAEEHARAEIQQQMDAEQKARQEQDQRQAEREALYRLKIEDPEQYKYLRQRAADALGIDPDRLRRGEKLKLELAMLGDVPK